MAAVLATVLLIVVLYGAFFLPSPSQLQASIVIDDTTAQETDYHQSYKPRTYPSRRHSQSYYEPSAHQAYQPQSRPADRQYKPKYLQIELNSADSTDLVQLYNVGPTFARRILRYRNLLGGYTDKDQLWEIYGMDSVRFNDIAPHVTVNADKVAKLDINTATLDQLKRHPYLDFHQARAIVQLRETAGPYHSIQDLAQVPMVDPNTISKLTPYITCNSQPSK